jgi:hypothetical protein
MNYHASDDILHIVFSNGPIIREVSHDWNVNLAFSTAGLCEITILDAKKAGYWPIENLSDLLFADAPGDDDAQSRADHGVFD